MGKNKRKRKLDIRGSISIFVALMMIPTMAFTGLTIDFARINMVSSQARNTADLAANSVLAYYDRLLFDIFGLMATSQDRMSTVVPMSRQFFRKQSMIAKCFDWS